MTLAHKRILVGVDGSEPSLRAIDTAVEIAQGVGARLELISVVDVGRDTFGSLVMSDEHYAKIESWIRQEVLATANRRVPSEGPRVSLRVLRGHPVQALLEETERGDVGLIVVGRTGKGALQKVLEGSVSKRLSKLSPVPVVVVA